MIASCEYCGQKNRTSDSSTGTKIAVCGKCGVNLPEKYQNIDWTLVREENHRKNLENDQVLKKSMTNVSVTKAEKPINNIPHEYIKSDDNFYKIQYQKNNDENITDSQLQILGLLATIGIGTILSTFAPPFLVLFAPIVLIIVIKLLKK